MLKTLLTSLWMLIIYCHVFTYNLVIYLLIIVQELMNKSDHDLLCKLCAPTHALNHLLRPRVTRSPVFYGRSRISDPFSHLPEGSHREEQLKSPVFCSSDCRVTQTTLWHVETSYKITIGPIYKYVVYSVSSQIIHWGCLWASAVWQLDSLIRYDTIRDAVLTCARKPTWVSLIYRARKRQLKIVKQKKTKK